MTTTQIRAALKALGLTVKLSRRNGIRAPVEVVAVSRDIVVIGVGATDLEAFTVAYQRALEALAKL